MTSAREAAWQHCLELVRAADKDRFLASLFIADESRPHVLALYAFNIEIARVREMVSDAAIGEIRYQWWRDTLEAIYAREVPGHPVAQGLAWAIEKGDLAKTALGNLIEARAFDLYDDPMPTVNDLEGYLGETSSILIQLCAIVLAGREAEASAQASGLAGVAYGLTGLLRSLPLHRARGQCYIPKELLAKHGLTPAHLLAGRDEAALGMVLQDVRDLARQRLGEARALAARVPHAALPAFLPVALVDGYLRKLDRLGSKALNTVADVAQFKRQFQLYRAARRENF